MIGEGLELMFVGMGVVFAFLIMLVLLMKLSGALLSKFPEPEPPAKPAGPTGGGGGAKGQDTVAVALAAAYRARKGS